MKVFKFYSSDDWYMYSGKTKEEAKEALLYEQGIEIDKIEGVPESEWDKKDILIYPDNDETQEPFFVSIREQMLGNTPMIICTTEFD